MNLLVIERPPGLLLSTVLQISNRTCRVCGPRRIPFIYSFFFNGLQCFSRVGTRHEVSGRGRMLGEHRTSRFFFFFFFSECLDFAFPRLMDSSLVDACARGRSVRGRFVSDLEPGPISWLSVSKDPNRKSNWSKLTPLDQ